jgi:hypothetical protein
MKAEMLQPAAARPLFVLGLPLTYSFEYLGNGSLRSVWGVLAWRLTGAIFGAAVFVTTHLALTYLYVNPSAASHYGYFTVGVGFSLPWLVVNGGLADYTAYAMSRRT